ncbi:elongation factor P [Patescibacteria group bacterium]
MIDATKLKNGTTFLSNGKPYKVEKYTHQKIGRGGANIKLTLRNLSTGDQEDKTVSSNNKFEEIDTIKKPMQYLYKDANAATFMDPKTFEQIELQVKPFEKELKFISEGVSVNLLFWEGRVLSIDIPPKMIVKIVNTAPGVKGDTASNVYKPAELENKVKLKVPLFIKQGDKIKVDTRTGEYVERVK